MANARMRNKPEDFERMGIDPKVVAPWEDGKRNGEAVGCIEWWYFDADLDDGTKINLNFATNPVSGHPEPGLHPFFYAIAPEPVKAAYDAIGAAPSITRHAAIGKLTVERPGQETIQVEGPLHYELSSQHRTFIM